MVYWYLLMFLNLNRIFIDAVTERCVYINYEGKKMNLSEIGCSKSAACKKEFKVSIIDLPPFSLAESLQKAVQQCCGPCTHFHVIHKFRNITEMTAYSLKESDLVLPFLASTSTQELHGYKFIPYIDVTDALYITGRRQLRLFQSIIQLYPLMVVCLLLALIAGFIIWLLETWLNEEEFPRDFLMGWFEGTWWSFVTMTTLGYGDKTPRSIGGRLFSISWILVGLVLCGILTATLTTEIIDANSSPPPDIKDAKVGALRYRDFEQLIIANKGGIFVKTDGIDFYSDLILLIDKLQKNDIDGILFDKYTLHFATFILARIYSTPSAFSNYSSYPLTENFIKSRINYFMNQTMRTDMDFANEKLAYGIMMKNTAAYEYLHHTISDNRLRNKIEYDLAWNKIKKKFSEVKKGSFYSAVNGLFSPTGFYFQTSIKVIASILIVICIFGFGYELKRGKLKKMGELYARTGSVQEEDNAHMLNRLKTLNPNY